MKKLILLTLFLPYVSFAQVDLNRQDPANTPVNSGDAVQRAVDACMKSDDLALCLETQRKLENIKHTVENTLEYFGIKREAIIVAAATSAITQQRVRLKVGSWDYIDLDRSVIEINRDYVNLTLEWSW